MKQAAISNFCKLISTIRERYSVFIFVFIAGLLGPLGFAPFHSPGFIIISVAIFYSILLNNSVQQSFVLGFVYGMGYFGFGVSWIILSIHDYGDLNYFFAGIITLVFISYLSLFPAAVAYVFKKIKLEKSSLISMFLFSILWCLSEFIRAHLLTGFPWLLIGTTQIDTPLRYLAPIIGVYGLSLLTAIEASLLVTAFRVTLFKRFIYLLTFVLILISPSLLKDINWTQVSENHFHCCRSSKPINA